MRKVFRYKNWIGVFVITLGCIDVSLAGGLSGTVLNEQGQSLEGVMVSLVDQTAKRYTTHYTDRSGTFRFGRVANDEKTLRLRLTGYADQNVPLQRGTEIITATLKPATQDELLQQLPAHVWSERVGVEDDRVQREFRVQCLMCHQQGYPGARWPKTQEQWYSVFDRMAHKRALLTEETRVTMAAALLEAYDFEGDLGLPRIPEPAKGKATEVEITEWRLTNSTASMHDVAVGPDGKIYGVDTIGNNIWRLNPATNEIEELTHLQPTNRGDSAELLLHTVFRAPDGKMWFTYAAGNLVASLDVYSEEMKVYEISYMDGIYPHTMRFDQDGQIWFTVAITNQLGTIDPVTDEVVLYDMPTRNRVQSILAWPPIVATWLWVQNRFSVATIFYDELLPIAYGIDVTPDGKIWFSQFNNRRIGSYDKRTETFEMVDTPFGGPRRFRADSKGTLWIPAFTDGLIYSYVPATNIFTPYEMPTGRGDSTYALAIDPRDDSIWACGSNSDTMMHLTPSTGEVITYQFPSRVTFCREISFADDGSVWTSYSNYPSGSIEGASSAFVRIKPLEDGDGDLGSRSEAEL